MASQRDRGLGGKLGGHDRLIVRSTWPHDRHSLHEGTNAGGGFLATVEALSPAPPDDPRHLAATLAPVLADACEGRLSDITWFRTDWQRGGAATGTARYRLREGRVVDVVVKLPVVQRELLWMQRLQDSNGQGSAEGLVVGRLYASGQTLG